HQSRACEGLLEFDESRTRQFAGANEKDSGQTSKPLLDSPREGCAAAQPHMADPRAAATSIMNKLGARLRTGLHAEAT
ncbi:MAG: hypothetical protein FD148_1671, partial [Methylocystaceae bacterium]